MALREVIHLQVTDALPLDKARMPAHNPDRVFVDVVATSKCIELEVLMGFDKFPRVPNLGPIIERKVSEGIINWVKNRKDGMPPESAAIDASFCRKVFPHMYSVYVITVTGSLHRC